MGYRTRWAGEARYTLRQQGVRRGLLALALALVLLVFAGVQYHRIATNEIGRLKEELEQRRREVVDAAYTTQLVAAYGAGKKQIAALEKKLQVKGVQSTLVHEMEKLCRLSAVQLLAQSYQEGSAESHGNGEHDGSDRDRGYAVLQHELVVAGNYYSLRRLIRDIEKLPTLSFIEEASFTPSSEQGDRFKLALRLSTYYRVEVPDMAR